MTFGLNSCLINKNGALNYSQAALESSSRDLQTSDLSAFYGFYSLFYLNQLWVILNHSNLFRTVLRLRGNDGRSGTPVKNHVRTHFVIISATFVITAKAVIQFHQVFLDCIPINSKKSCLISISDMFFMFTIGPYQRKK